VKKPVSKFAFRIQPAALQFVLRRGAGWILRVVVVWREVFWFWYFLYSSNEMEACVLLIRALFLL
jgi:hypothetical protein